MNDVAAWFIDHDYDEESFFLRQAYFVGDDPYDGLKRALRAEIDEAAWAELNSTVSRPFPKPARGRICVTVINHFGDEVQKVFSVQTVIWLIKKYSGVLRAMKELLTAAAVGREFARARSRPGCQGSCPHERKRIRRQHRPPLRSRGDRVPARSGHESQTADE